MGTSIQKKVAGYKAEEWVSFEGTEAENKKGYDITEL